MTAYSYDSETMVYIGPTPCQLDPIRTKLKNRPIYLLPANATFVNPPAYDENVSDIVYNGEKWEVREKKLELPEKERTDSNDYKSFDTIEKIDSIINSF